MTAEVIQNPGSPEDNLKITLLHERRGATSEPWAPATTIPLTKVKAGELVQFALDSAETSRLFDCLEQMYAVAGHGPQAGTRRWTVLHPGQIVLDADVSEFLANYEPEQLSALLEVAQPDLTRFLADRAVHERRRSAVAEFEAHLAEGDWGEEDWHRFFTEHTWMFGLGLRYQFLQFEESKPNLGRKTFRGRGGVEGDVMLSTQAAARFTVLVELKRPDAVIVHEDVYRNRVHKLGVDLTHGAAQVQEQCESWAESANDPDNHDLIDRGVLTVQPRGLLLIGNSASLGDEHDRWRTFEHFRRNLLNPEVLTYDELLARARVVVNDDQGGDMGGASFDDSGL